MFKKHIHFLFSCSNHWKSTLLAFWICMWFKQKDGKELICVSGSKVFYALYYIQDNMACQAVCQEMVKSVISKKLCWKARLFLHIISVK